MKNLVLLSLSLAVALGMPPNPPGVPQSPVLPAETQNSLDGVWVPVQAPADSLPEETEEEPRGREELEGGEAGPDVKGVLPEEEEEALMKERDDVLDGEPIMELEPLDDGNMDKSLRKDPVNQPLPEEEVMKDNVSDGEPIMELEPLDEELSDIAKTLKAAFQNQNPVLGEQPIMELEPLDDDNVEKPLRKDPVPEEEEEEVMKDNVSDGEPIMELEPIEDLSDVEKSLKAAFQNQNPVLGEQPIMELEPLDDGNMDKSLRKESVNQPLPEEEEEELTKERHNILDGEPIMELEPQDEELSDIEKSLKAAFQNQNPVLGEQPIMELEPLDDNMEKSLRKDPVPEEEEEEVMKDNVSDGEPIMELEPLDEELSDIEKSLKAAFQNQNPVLGEEPIMELDPEDAAVVDITGQKTPSLEEKHDDE